MTKVLFVCLGNICRSPMAEFVLKDMVRRRGLEDEFIIESRGTSSEEIGNDVHYGTVRKLNSVGVSKENRKVIFTTAIALAEGDKLVTAEEKIEGYISEEPRGKNGFGFDEIFELENGKTLAELSQEEKNEISARKKALESIKAKLK